MTTQAQPVPPTPLDTQEDYPPIAYAWYVVGVLTVIYIFSFIDRQILALIVEPIKRDLQISDTKMGYLMGLYFVGFYTLFGILFGRLADTRSRRLIIAAGFLAWSFMTALSGIAQNYWQMAGCRFGVGIGEAALAPAAYSLITDYFRKERLATAISVYSMGIYLGAGMAYLLGGIVVGFATSQEMYDLPIIGATRPWQVIFFLVGIPGVLLAPLIYTIKEPKRHQKILNQTSNQKGSFREFVDYVRLNRQTFIFHGLGFGLIALATNAGGSWHPVYLVRTFGWPVSKVGIVLGAILATSGTLGIVSAGRFSDYLFERGYKDAPLRVGMFAVLALVPFGILFSLAPNATIAIAAYIPLAFFASAPFGVAPAAIQQIMPNTMRGQATAVYIFSVNIIGLGLGPLAVALMTDAVFHDPNKIRYSLLIVGGIAQLLAALSLWNGLKPFIESLERLKDWVKVNS
jgi:MFS family permease